MNILLPQSTSAWLMILFLGGAVAVSAAGYLLLQAGRDGKAGEDDAAGPDGDLRPAARPGGARDAPGLAKSLALAGFDHKLAVPLFYAAKAGLALAFALGCGWFFHIAGLLQDAGAAVQIAVLISVAGLGFWLPTMLVDKLEIAWKRRIDLGIPDALDFMLVCVEAGQSLDLAAQRVATELETVHPDLAERFQALTKSLAAGADRQDAFNHLATSTGSDDLRQFSTLVVQSATMGTPVAHSLRVFAADLRDRRVRRVEAKAAVLPTKMSLGTMMFTVPPLLVLLLAPAIWRIVNLM